MTPGRFSAIVEKKIKLTPNVVLVRLGLAPARRWRFIPGQYVVLEIPLGKEILERPFSIASLPNESRHIELLVRLVPGGVASGFFEKSRRGAAVTFYGPRGNFKIRSARHPLRFIASGTGIAPFRPMLYDLLEIRRAIVPIKLAVIAPSIQEALLEKEFRARALRHANLEYTLVTKLDDYFERFGVSHGEDIYLCGGILFVKDTKAILIKKGVGEGNIYHEEFI